MPQREVLEFSSAAEFIEFIVLCLETYQMLAVSY